MAAQLAKITAPNINAVDYAKDLSDSFNLINENFKKIASLPFLQGAQGDSFQTKEYEIWHNNSGVYTLTEKGAILLNSIFNTNVLEEGFTFNGDDVNRSARVKINQIAAPIKGVSAIDIFTPDEETGEVKNNILYFYSVIDQYGDVSLEYIGQYYHFVDQRLTQLAGFQFDKTINLSGFNDYSGFYQYINDGSERFARISMVPSLYYDQKNNDICWKFNEKETGISAVGVSGADGLSSSVYIVAVHGTPSVGNANIEYQVTNGQWSEDLTVQQGDVIVACIYQDGVDIPNYNPLTDTQNLVHFSFGQVTTSASGGKQATWNLSMVFTQFLQDVKLYDYIQRIGEKSNVVNSQFEPFGFFIPVVKGCTEYESGSPIKQGVHMIWSGKDDKNLNLARTKGPKLNTATDILTEIKDFIVRNYNLIVNNWLNVKSGALIEGTYEDNFNGTTDDIGLRVKNDSYFDRSIYTLSKLFIQGKESVSSESLYAEGIVRCGGVYTQGEVNPGADDSWTGTIGNKKLDLTKKYPLVISSEESNNSKMVIGPNDIYKVQNDGSLTTLYLQDAGQGGDVKIGRNLLVNQNITSNRGFAKTNYVVTGEYGIHPGTGASWTEDSSGKPKYIKNDASTSGIIVKANTSSSNSGRKMVIGFADIYQLNSDGTMGTLCLQDAMSGGNVKVGGWLQCGKGIKQGGISIDVNVNTKTILPLGNYADYSIININITGASGSSTNDDLILKLDGLHSFMIYTITFRNSEQHKTDVFIGYNEEKEEGIKTLNGYDSWWSQVKYGNTQFVYTDEWHILSKK